MRILVLGMLAAALLVPPGAEASSVFYVRGHGFGHGIGMSQYGAYGLAQHGASDGDILTHYYAGTAIGAVSPAQPVPVLLEVAGRVSFTGGTAAGTRALDPAKTYSAQETSTGLVRLLSPTGRTLADFPAPLSITAPTVRVSGHALNGVSNGAYRGGLLLAPSGGALRVINQVALDDYVRGVVAAEMPSSWAPAALEAQAIAARTYAITTAGATPLYPDTRSQMYRGMAAETPSTDAAVAATQGQVVEYAGTPVTTYFMSTSGGQTENVEDSFLGTSPEPWLVSVADPYDSISPRHTWGPIRMTLTSAGRRLGRLVKGRFLGIVVTQRGHSPRVVRAQIVGSRGRTNVTGPQLRARFGLYDTWAYFTSMSAKAKAKAQPAPQTNDGPSGGAAPPPATASAAMTGKPWVLTGTVSPGKPGAVYALQRGDGRRWVTIGHGRLRRGGSWQATVKGAGRYRILLDGLAAPSVRVH